MQYRERDDRGGYSGGPMYYIRNGLGKRYGILATAFACSAPWRDLVSPIPCSPPGCPGAGRQQRAGKPRAWF